MIFSTALTGVDPSQIKKVCIGYARIFIKTRGITVYCDLAQIELIFDKFRKISNHQQQGNTKLHPFVMQLVLGIAFSLPRRLRIKTVAE